MFTIGPYEYFALILGAALSAFVLSSFFFLVLAVVFHFSVLTGFLMALAVTIISPLIAHHYIIFTVQKRIREVDVNLLDALRHLLSELSAGIPLGTAIESIANADYGMVSELFRESVVLIKGGEDVDEAFRISSARTKSLPFQRFVATLSYATASGANIEAALKAYIDELEFTQANEISLYANEAIRDSTFMVIITGVIPGLLVFMISQGSVISSIRIPVIYLLPIYLIAFPLVKYLLTVRLIKSSPGV
ncbi:Type II secretion system (T2SS), protein F [Candidatus Burarchaeum australiense]|nr:Type II secretion system (T2SS), protein F [Candidatus Burarchaeum australiense]